MADLIHSINNQWNVFSDGSGVLGGAFTPSGGILFTDGTSINSGFLINTVGKSTVDWNQKLFTGGWSADSLSISGQSVLLTGNPLTDVSFRDISGRALNLISTIQIPNNVGISSRLVAGTPVTVLIYDSNNRTLLGANSEIKLGGSVWLQPLAAENNNISASGGGVNIIVGPTTISGKTPLTTSDTGTFMDTNATGALRFSNLSNASRAVAGNITGGTWYRVAQTTSGANRFAAYVDIGCNGGPTPPSSRKFYISHDWQQNGNITLLHQTLTNTITGIRLVKETGFVGAYVEVIPNATVSGTLFNVTVQNDDSIEDFPLRAMAWSGVGALPSNQVVTTQLDLSNNKTFGVSSTQLGTGYFGVSSLGIEINNSLAVTQAQTGIYSGSFYPSTSNPSGYLTGSTGGFINSNQTGAFYPKTGNPSGFLIPANTGFLAAEYVGTVELLPNNNQGLFFANNQSETSSPIWGAFMTNGLTNWVKRGGTLNTYVSGAVTITSPRNVVEPALDKFSQHSRGFTTLSRSGSGTAVFEFTGINFNVPSHGQYSPFLIQRTPHSYTNLKVEFYGTSGDWITVFDASPSITGFVWGGPYGGWGVSGVRFSISSSGASDIYLNELGIWNRNYVKGTNLYAFIHSDVTFSGIVGNALTVSGATSISGSSIVTKNQTGTLVGLDATGALANSFVSFAQTGSFYPRVGNPSGFITGSGNFVTNSKTGNFLFNAMTGNVNISSPFTIGSPGSLSINGSQRTIFSFFEPTYGVQYMHAIDGNSFINFAANGPSGASTPLISGFGLFATGIKVSGVNVITQNDTGSFYPRNNPSGYVTSSSGVLALTNVSGVLTSGDIVIDTGSWYEVTSGTLTSGTWLINGQLHGGYADSYVNIAARLLTAPSTIHHVGIATTPQNFGAQTGFVTIPLNTIINVTGSTLVKLQVASSIFTGPSNGATIFSNYKWNIGGSATGVNTKATYFLATKIG
jgi:hypothetical protein